MNAQSAHMLARAPLGAAAEARYGAPYWVIHRGDLQAVLIEAVGAHQDISLHLGARVEDFALHKNGVTISALASQRPVEERGCALICADGLWSKLRERLGHRAAPQFAHHTAWRALAPADALVPDLRAPAVNLWLGRDAHLVHYPVRGGSLINIVAIIRDDWREPGWNAPGMRARHPRPLSLRPVAEGGTRDSRGAGALAQMGALRPRSDRPLGQGTGHPPRGRGPPDAALSRPGRGHGDRGRGGAGATAWRIRPTIPTARCDAMNGSGAHAPRAPNARPAATAWPITWAAPGRCCARLRSSPWVGSA